jgi:hypothetical protein
VHRPPSPATDDLEPVVLDLPIEQPQHGFGHHRATLPERPANPPGEVQGLRGTADDQRTITLQRQAKFVPNSDGVALNIGQQAMRDYLTQLRDGRLMSFGARLGKQCVRRPQQEA